MYVCVRIYIHIPVHRHTYLCIYVHIHTYSEHLGNLSISIIYFFTHSFHIHWILNRWGALAGYQGCRLITQVRSQVGK